MMLAGVINVATLLPGFVLLPGTVTFTTHPFGGAKELGISKTIGEFSAAVTFVFFYVCIFIFAALVAQSQLERFDSSISIISYIW